MVDKLNRVKHTIYTILKTICTPGYWLNEKMYWAEGASIVPAFLSATWNICVILFNFIYAEPIHEKYEFWLTVVISLLLMGAGTTLAVLSHLLVVRFLYFISAPFASIYRYCEKKIIKEKIDLMYFVNLEKKQQIPCVRFFLK